MKSLVAFTVLFGFMLVACTTQIPTPSQAEIIFMAAQTVASNQDVSYNRSFTQPTKFQISPYPTQISAATTLIPSTHDSANIATQIAMPKQGHPSSRIYGLSMLDNGSLLVTVEFSPLPKGPFTAELGQDKLQCNTLPDHRNRIFCHGLVSRNDLVLPFLLYQEGKLEPVFSSDLWIPPVPQASLVSSPDHLTMERFYSTPIPTRQSSP